MWTARLSGVAAIGTGLWAFWSEKGLVGLQAVVDKHTETIDDLSTYAVHSHAEMQEQLRLVTRRLDRMAADDREDADDA